MAPFFLTHGVVVVVVGEVVVVIVCWYCYNCVV